MNEKKEEGQGREEEDISISMTVRDGRINGILYLGAVAQLWDMWVSFMITRHEDSHLLAKTY